MSSAIYVTFSKDEGVSGDNWEPFCAEHGIIHSPQTVGRNVFYAGGAEITFGAACYDKLPALPNGRLDFAQATPPDYAEEVTFSTYHMGSAMTQVAALAQAFWLRFGGSVSADEELRPLFLADAPSATEATP